tara:strand:+ start:310 stop:612 length:303 start_codon:yes stop_codon:yes gene_type:complete
MKLTSTEKLIYAASALGALVLLWKTIPANTNMQKTQTSQAPELKANYSNYSGITKKDKIELIGLISEYQSKMDGMIESNENKDEISQKLAYYKQEFQKAK